MSQPQQQPSLERLIAEHGEVVLCGDDFSEEGGPTYRFEDGTEVFFPRHGEPVITPPQR